MVNAFKGNGTCLMRNWIGGNETAETTEMSKSIWKSGRRWMILDILTSGDL